MPQLNESPNSNKLRKPELTKVKAKRHPITGCRADTLMGMWLIDPKTLDGYRNLVSAYDLKTMKEMSAEIEPAPPKMLPTVNGTKVARIDINGPTSKYETSFQAIIGGASTLWIQRLVKQAVANPEVAAIMLCIDSPGGTCHGAFDLSDVLAKAARTKPLIVFGNGMMTSASQLFASQGTYTIVTPETYVGSIGIKAVIKDTSEAAAKMGVKIIEVTSGTLKSYGEPGTPVTKEQVALIQQDVDNLSQMFIGYVAKGRGLDGKAISGWQAAMFHASKGKELGLIDEIGDEEKALTIVSEAAANPAAFLEKNNKQRTPVGAPTTAPSTAADSAVRGTRIMLNPEQLNQAKQLPGAKATLTAENADVELLTLASTLATENKALREAGVAPLVKLPDKMAEQYIKLAHGNVDLLAKQEKFVPAQAEMLKGMIGKDCVAPDGTINISLDNMLKVMDTNRPGGLVDDETKEMTGAQPAAKLVQGEKDNKEDTLTKEQISSLAALATSSVPLGGRN